VARAVSLRVLDMLWMNHLEEMEALRDSVRLRAYGQQDPLVEYKTEGHKTFKRLLDTIESNIVQTILHAGLQKEASSPAASVQQDKNEVGRNDLCPCGSGKKYKKCHGK
jgi:preprotein translocase subunit SecA